MRVTLPQRAILTVRHYVIICQSHVAFTTYTELQEVVTTVVSVIELCLAADCELDLTSFVCVVNI